MSNPAETHEKLLIVDFGSQVTKLIARRVRESGVYSEVHPFNRIDAALLKRFNPKAIILSGGPSSVIGTGTPRAHGQFCSCNGAFGSSVGQFCSPSTRFVTTDPGSSRTYAQSDRRFAC